MSRTLPEKPNLEYLKKEAKALQRTMPQAKLADAQHALAQEYGFAGWAKLKAHVQSLTLTPGQALTAAVRDMDAGRVRQLLERHAELRARIDAPLENYGDGIHAIFAAVQRSDRATIDALLAFGARIRQRTERGFGVLDECDPSLVEFLLERGAAIDAHSAARLGMVDKLREFAADGNARGGDGRTPLHFASTLEVAEFLLAHGAEIDARDRQGETPAQQMLRTEHRRHYPHDRQPIARYLVSHGCYVDIFIAAALGDLDLARQVLDRDPDCVATTWHGQTPHAMARDFGHEGVYRLLLERTPHALKLALACDLGDEATFRELLARRPDLARSLSEEELRKLPKAAQNGNAGAVRLMLEAGWPVDATGEMGATALHWAGFNGNAGMAREILRYSPSLEIKSTDYAGTPLSWAIFGSGDGWNRETGDYVGAVRELLAAGALLPPHWESLEPSEDVLGFVLSAVPGVIEK